MNFQIVTVAQAAPKDIYPPEVDYYLWDEFLASAHRWGHEPLVLGWGQKFEGLGRKPALLKRAIESGQVTADAICFCDAFDVIFGADPEETAKSVIAELRDIPQSIMFNAERDLFPAVVPEEDFPKSPTAYRFLNSGLSIGLTEAYHDELVAMDADNIPADIINGPLGNVHHEDQSPWQKRFCYGGQIELDVCCEFFQTLHGHTAEEFDFTGDRIRNVTTGTTPDIWHGNGSAKTSGLMPPILEKLGLK